MSKQITAKELAQIITTLLTDTESAGCLDEAATFERFMTDIAEVVCNYCGGEIRNPASFLDEVCYVGIHGNDSLPEDGGIWKGFDPEGALDESATEIFQEDDVAEWVGLHYRKNYDAESPKDKAEWISRYMDEHHQDIPREISPTCLKKLFGEEHPRWPMTDWQYEVANGDTGMGYWEWVSEKQASHFDDLHLGVA